MKKLLSALGLRKPHPLFEVPRKYFELYPLEEIQLPKENKPAFEAPGVKQAKAKKKRFGDLPESDGRSRRGRIVITGAS